MSAAALADCRDACPVGSWTEAETRSSVDRAIACAFDQRGGHAWTWDKPLTGTCSPLPTDARLEVEVDGRAFPVSRAGDRFATRVRFVPGPNEVVAVATLPDGTRVASAPVVYDAKLRPRPTARLSASIAGERVVFDATGSVPSDYDGSPIVAWSVAAHAGNPGRLDLVDDALGIVSAAVPAAPGEYVAELVVADVAGRTDAAAARFVVEDGDARVPHVLHERSAWIAPAVVYGVVPRNFDPPGFAGVAARLDDLKDLGVAALWFSPITRTPEGRFGYEVTDYFATNPALGAEDEFRALVAQAHARGLRVLLDVVPNHTSDDHPYYRDVLAHGAASPYRDFYDRDAGGNATHYFDWSHLPNLNHVHPEVRRFTLEAVVHWVRDFDVDGLRIDAVWGIKERCPAWLAELVAEVRRIKPDALIIAEASARDAEWFDLGFDAAYDWTRDLGKWAWDGVFGSEESVGGAVVEALTDGGAGYHPRALVLRFLNNNDTGARFLTTHGVECYRAALAMLLTLPGLTCLFTGDEVGAEFLPYAAAQPIDRNDRHELRPFVEHLIALRRDHPSLHSRSWTPLLVEPAAQCFAYLREDDRAVAATTLIVLNFSQAAVDAMVTLQPSLADRWAGAELRDLLDAAAPTGRQWAVGNDGRLAMTVPAGGARIVSDERG